MKWIANLTGGYTSSAKVVDGALVLSLPDAIAPVVWRMELGQVKSSALEVREKDEGTFMLTLKTPKGDVSEIAPFDERAKAIRALMAVSHAMEQGHGHSHPVKAVANDDSVKPATGGTPPPHNGAAQPARKSNAAASVIGIVILVAMVAGLMMMGPRGAGGPGDARMSGASGTGSAAANTTGVPVSADDFLRNR